MGQLKDDEYEILPHAEIEYLRKEVEKLKRNPLGDTQASLSLIDGLNKLNTTMEQMLAVLQGANDDMVRTFNDRSFKEELTKVRQENAKIAHGIVALSEMVKAVEDKMGEMKAQEQVIERQVPQFSFDTHQEIPDAGSDLGPPKNPFEGNIPYDEVPPPPPGS